MKKYFTLVAGQGVYFMNTDFKKLLMSIRPSQMRTVAVANAIDVYGLRSLVDAYKLGFARAILCGDVDEIKSIAEKNNIDIKLIDLLPLHDVVKIKGSFLDLTKDPTNQITDYIYFTLTDERVVTNAMKRLKVKYPNAVSLKYENKTRNIDEYLRRCVAIQLLVNKCRED